MVTAYSYHSKGNVLTVTDAKSQQTIYTYSNMNRTATRKDPLVCAVLSSRLIGYACIGLRKNYSFGFSSSSANCFGKRTGTTIPMGSPRLMVVGFVSCNRKLAVKAS